MELKSKATIIQSVYSRPVFALRFLWHAARTRFPYPIIVADGKSANKANKMLASLIENSTALRQANIKYLPYDDNGYGDYAKKLAGPAMKADTPYVAEVHEDVFALPFCVD